MISEPPATNTTTPKTAVAIVTVPRHTVSQCRLLSVGTGAAYRGLRPNLGFQANHVFQICRPFLRSGSSPISF